MDASGNAYVTWLHDFFDFPATAGALQTAYPTAYDAFVLKLNPTGSARIYSTFLGGISDDFSAEIAVDASFNAYVTGTTSPPTSRPRPAPSTPLTTASTMPMSSGSRTSGRRQHSRSHLPQPATPSTRSTA